MDSKTKNMLRSILGEFLVTFIFLSTVLAVIINSSRSSSAGSIATIISGIAPGIVVAFVAVAIIFAFADVSGAHFNPAVTIGFMITRKIDFLKGLAYIVSQLVASIVAASFQYAIFPNDVNGWATIAEIIPVVKPESTPVVQALFMEIFLTFVLVYIIFSTAVDSPAPPSFVRSALHPESASEKELNSIGSPSDADLESAGNSTKRYNNLEGVQVYTTPGPSKNNFAPIAIGLTLGFLCFLGGSSSGGAFNPARVFGAALISGNFDSHWIYWVGDLIGGALAAIIHTFIFARQGALFSS